MINDNTLFEAGNGKIVLFPFDIDECNIIERR